MAKEQHEILWPLGRRVVADIAANDGIGSLDGRTIAFVWDYLFRGREMFEVIKSVIATRFPQTTFVDYEEFGNIHGGDAEEKANLELLPARMSAQGAVGAVVAVGA